MRSRKAKKKSVVKNYPSGRFCRKSGCRQRLSIYNSESYCHVHLQDWLTNHDHEGL